MVAKKQTKSVIFPHVLLLPLLLCTAAKSETPSCTGGPFLSGISADLWESNAADTLPGCCDPSGTCYSPTSPADFSEIADSLQASLKSIIPIRRFASGTSRQKPTIVRPENHPTDSTTTMGLCCQSRMSVFYPLSGISAITGNRVSIIQIPELLNQPVVYESCSKAPCRILRGNCTQVYMPMPLYVLEEDSSTSKLDFVFVETGCRCQNSLRLPEEEILVGSETGVDETARGALSYLTGRDLFDQELITTSNQDDKDVIVVNEELLLCTLKPEESSSIIHELNVTLISDSNERHSIWHDTPRKIAPGDFDPVWNLIKDHLVK